VPADLRLMIRRASLAVLLCSAGGSSTLAAQAPSDRTDGRARPPTISARSFSSGSVTIQVTGGIQIDAKVPINVEASIADGEMTWLQYGASGSKEPNALITVGTQEIGVSAGQGRQIFTVDAASCTGKIEVTETIVSGRYSCKGVTSYDAASGKMSTVDVAVGFTARS